MTCDRCPVTPAGTHIILYLYEIHARAPTSAQLFFKIGSCPTSELGSSGDVPRRVRTERTSAVHAGFHVLIPQRSVERVRLTPVSPACHVLGLLLCCILFFNKTLLQTWLFSVAVIEQTY